MIESNTIFVIKITDIELSQISPEIQENYGIALDFINTNPDYSLLKFRNIAEYVVQLIAQKNAIEFESESNNLIDKIKYLFDCQLISKPLERSLHEIRLLGNDGAHDNFLAVETELKQAQLKEKACRARLTVVSVLEDIYFICYNKKIKANTTELTDIKKIENKEVIYKASLSSDYKMKLKAGLIYQAMMKEYHHLKHTHTGKSFSGFHFKNLCQLALTFYESACEISAEIEKYLDDTMPSAENIIIKYADAEALYRYGSLIIRTDFINDPFYRKRGVERLKASADRGYDEAEYWYGWFLYYHNNAYKKALYYLEQSERKDDVRSLLLLFSVYTEGKACTIDNQKALEYLNRGIELGCEDCLATLGLQYYKGTAGLKRMKKKAQH